MFAQPPISFHAVTQFLIVDLAHLSSVWGNGGLFRELFTSLRKAFNGILKLISNELQLSCKFTMSVNMPTPSAFRGFLGVVNLVNFDFASIFPFECISDWEYNYHTKVVLNTAFPFFFMLFILAVYHACAASERYHDLKHQVGVRPNSTSEWKPVVAFKA